MSNQKSGGESNWKLFTGIGLGFMISLASIAVWRLFLKNSALTGLVTDEAHNPVPGAKITLKGGDGYYVETYSAADGSYNFGGDIKTSYILEGYPYFYYYSLTVDTGRYQQWVGENLIFHPEVNTLNVSLEAL